MDSLNTDILVPHGVGAIVFVSMMLLSSVAIAVWPRPERAPSEKRVVAILLEAQGVLLLLPLLLFWPTAEVVDDLTDLEAAVHTVVDYPTVVLADIKQTSFENALCENARLQVLNETEDYEVPNYAKFEYDYNIAYAGSGALLAMTALYVLFKRYRAWGLRVVSFLMWVVLTLLGIAFLGARAVVLTACDYKDTIEADHPDALVLFKADSQEPHPFLDALLQIEESCSKSHPLTKHLTPGVLSPEWDTLQELCVETPDYLLFAFIVCALHIVVTTALSIKYKNIKKESSFLG